MGTIKFGEVEVLLNITKFDYELFGSIPSQIGKLSELTELNLGYQSLQGEIPKELFNLEKLRILNIAYNELSSTLPSQIGLLKDLEVLDISWNFLSGQIPKEVYTLSNLTVLDIGVNDFSGVISSEIGNLYKLEFLAIERSLSLEGPLPSEIGILENLQELRLTLTKFEGELPAEFWKLPNLTKAAIALTGMGGTIPSDILGLTKLTQLSLDRNGMSGSIPPSFGRLSNLRAMYLSDNRFTSVLPSQLGYLTQVESWQFDNNAFESPIPSEMFSLNTTRHIDLRGNKFSTIPTQIGLLKQLETFYMDNVTGTIPTEIGDNKQLRKLVLDNGDLISTIPSVIQHLHRLETLSFSFNKLSGIVPSFQMMNDIVEVRLNNNKFSGPLPLLGSSATRFYAQENNFNGSIPQLPETLKILRVEENQLSGRIPDFICNLSNLEDLSLNGNNLAGQIPDSIGKLGELRSLTLNDNRLDPVIPRAIERLERLSIAAFDPLKCDCKLLSWFADYVEKRFSERRFGEQINFLVECNDENEHEGRLPYLLKSSDLAPCSNPVFVEEKGSVGSDTIQLFLEYPEHTIDFAFRKVHFDALSEFEKSRFMKCENFHVRQSLGDRRILGYRIRWRNLENTSDINESCYPATSETSIDAFNITNLVGYTRYSFFATRFVAYFTLDRTRNVIYAYGPESKEFVSSTDIGRPSGTIIGLRATNRDESSLDLTWEDIPADQRNGMIEEYEVRFVVFNTTKYGTTLSTRYFLTDLEENLGVEVTIRGATIRDKKKLYGPWSKPILFRTCPMNSRDRNTGTCQANPGFYKENDGVVRSCSSLTEHYNSLRTSCVELGTTVETLDVNDGFWRPALDTSDIFPCPNREYCRPDTIPLDEEMRALQGIGELPSDVYCAENHTGIYCFSCSEDLVPSPTGCRECTEQEISKSYWGIGLATALILGIFFIFCLRILYVAEIFATMLRRNTQKTASQRRNTNPPGFREPRMPVTPKSIQKGLRSAKSITHAAATATKTAIKYKRKLSVDTKARIFIGYLQVFFSYRNTFLFQEVKLASAKGIEFLSNFDPVAITDALFVRCLYDYSHYEVLLIKTLVPFGLLAVLWILCFCLAKATSVNNERIKTEFYWSVLVILFWVYASVSQTIFETLWCESFVIDGETVSRIRSDYRTECAFSRQRIGWLVYTFIMILVYPIGTIILFIRDLIVYKRTVNDQNASEELLRRYSFLVAPYKESAFWFETYELIRKLIQTSLIGFLYNAIDPANQRVLGLIALNLTTLALIILAYFSPYKKPSDFLFALISLLLLIPLAQVSILDPFAANENKKLLISPVGVILLIEIAFFCLFFAWDCICLLYPSLNITAKIKNSSSNNNERGRMNPPTTDETHVGLRGGTNKAENSSSNVHDFKRNPSRVDEEQVSYKNAEGRTLSQSTVSREIEEGPKREGNISEDESDTGILMKEKAHGKGAMLAEILEDKDQAGHEENELKLESLVSDLSQV